MVAGSKLPRGAALPVTTRLEIARLHAAGKSAAAIADELKICRQTVGKWINRTSQGNINVSPRSGRPKVLSATQRSQLRRKVKGKRRRSQREMAHVFHVSRSTIGRTLKELKLNKYRIRRRYLLTRHAIKKRREFAAEFLKNDVFLHNGFFSDECHFYLHAAPNPQNDVVYDTDGENIPTSAKVQRESAVRVWGAISQYGTSQLIVYSGNLSAQRFIKEVLQKEVCQSARKLFRDEPYCFVQDNAPIHSAKATQQWLLKSNVHDFIASSEWPGYSPDLNPIENIWAILAERVRKHNPSSRAAFERLLKKEWKNLEPGLLKKTVLSAKNRLQQCLERDGYATDF